MQAAQDHGGSHGSIPPCELIRALSERQMHTDTDHFRQRVTRRRALEQIFVPVTDFPVLGCCAGNTRECECGREYMFAEARDGILRIKRVEQQRVPP